MMSTIQDTITEIASDLALLEDMDRIVYLVDISKRVDPLPDALKTPETKVYGCASETWLVVDETDGTYTLRFDSETAIVKGLLALLARVIDGRGSEEILGLDEQQLLDQIGLGGSISNRRMNGFASAILKVKQSLGRAAA